MMETLLKTWSEQRPGTRCVLCSVIQWKGSVPRKDYPVMLVLEDGRTLGTIGGGSMELKVTHAALDTLNQAGSKILEFDMTGTDVQADVGLCGGSLKILVEPFTDDLADFYKGMLQKLSDQPRLMILLSMQGQELLTVRRELILTHKDLAKCEQKWLNRLQTAFEIQQNCSCENADQHLLLWQVFHPPHLHIFGAGHVGQSVAQLAHFNNVSVQVYDDRAELLTAERFPHAKRHPIEFPVIWETLPHIPGSDVILIASREHKHDRELLSGLLKYPRGYVGLVSSSRKWKLLAEALLGEGFSNEILDRVHAPVGFPIEAQTVPEIATSIMAEIIAYYRSSGA